LTIILGSIVFYSIFLFLSDISSLESNAISFKYEYVLHWKCQYLLRYWRCEKTLSRN